MILDFPPPEGPSSIAFSTRYDYDGAGNLIYQGWALATQPNQAAPAAPLSSAAIWTIKRYTYNGSNQLTKAEWANGNNNAMNIWDDRAALNYQ